MSFLEKFLMKLAFSFKLLKITIIFDFKFFCGIETVHVVYSNKQIVPIIYLDFVFMIIKAIL